MNLKEAIDDRLIEIDLNANSKDEAITLLSQKLKDADYIDDVESFKKDIFYRESLGSTGIGNYIAIPHGKSSSVKKTGVAIGKLVNEIEWETLDGKGVKVVCLFAVGDNPESSQIHLELLADFASKLGNDEVVEKLLKAESVDEIKKIFE